MSYDYKVSKVVDAPVGKVWQAWTTADWTAGIFRGASRDRHVEARPGGKFTVTMTLPDGAEESMAGTYAEVADYVAKNGNRGARAPSVAGT